MVISHILRNLKICCLEIYPCEEFTNIYPGCPVSICNNGPAVSKYSTKTIFDGFQNVKSFQSTEMVKH